MENKPQFSFDQLYVPIFTSKRAYKPDGTYTIEKLSNNSVVTGIRILDEFLRQVQAGNLSTNSIAKISGLSISDQSTFIRLLTGMRSREFIHKYMLRRAIDLLKYTSLSCEEIAHKCGFSTAANLSAAFLYHYKDRPLHYRQRKQTKLDIDFYGL